MTTHKLRSIFATAIMLLIFEQSLAAEPMSGVWAGQVRGPKGLEEASFAFSENGIPLWQYRVKGSNALRQVELIRSGQSWRYVPPGGGVMKVTVLAIEVNATRVRYAVATSFEGSGGAFVDQVSTVMYRTFELTNAGLTVETKVQDRVLTTAVGNIGIDGPTVSMTGRSDNVRVYRGTLRPK